MRTRTAVAVTAAASLLLAACGDDGETDTTDPAATDAGDEAAPEDGAAEDPLAGADELPDPNDDVVDGVYAGAGVRVPVPDGFELDPAAAAQGLVVAISDGGDQQLLSQAIDVEALGDTGEELTLDTLVADNRDQFPQDATVDEPFELSDGSAAHQLVYEDLPAMGGEAPPVEDGGEAPAEPDVDVAVVVADDGAGRLAQFTYVAPSDVFDDAVLTALLEGSTFDPDSDPVPPVPVAPEGEVPAPEGDVPAPDDGGVPAPEGEVPAPEGDEAPAAPEGDAPAG